MRDRLATPASGALLRPTPIRTRDPRPRIRRHTIAERVGRLWSTVMQAADRRALWYWLTAAAVGGMLRIVADQLWEWWA